MPFPGPFLYSSDGISSVNVIDPVALTVLSTVGVGGAPQRIVSRPDGVEVWTCVPGSGIWAIDTASDTVSRVISASDPTSVDICFTPDSSTAFVVSAPTSSSASIRKIDVATGGLLANVNVSGLAGEAIAMTPDGNTVCVEIGGRLDWYDTSLTIHNGFIAPGTNSLTGAYGSLAVDPTSFNCTAGGRTSSIDFALIEAEIRQPNVLLGILTTHAVGETTQVARSDGGPLGSIFLTCGRQSPTVAGVYPPFFWGGSMQPIIGSYTGICTGCCISADGLTGYAADNTDSDISVIDLGTVTETATVAVSGAQDVCLTPAPVSAPNQIVMVI